MLYIYSRNMHEQSMPRAEEILSGNMQVDICCNHVYRVGARC